MRITVIGTRGIPNFQGGVETHCEELYPRLVKLNYQVHLVRRSCYVPPDDKLTEYKGVQLSNLFTVRKITIETLLHTFLAVLWARKEGTDILHVHAIGPGIFIPLARLLGLKVVFTHHGPDYNRAKWGPFARFVLRLGERWGTASANEVIVISEVIKELLETKYHRIDTNLIFNGVSQPVLSEETDYIKSLGIDSRKYIFTLGRFVEEKGFDLLINAFSELKQNEYKLVIAGDADHEIPYTKQLKKLAGQHNVILPGFIKGRELHQLFTHARLFVLPSFHEGLPISLLEAMSYKLPVLVSDIPANKQIMLPDHRYFMSGSTDSLITGLKGSLNQKFEEINYDMSAYDWDKIAVQTAAVYEKLHKKLGRDKR
ncbi:MAG: glycosyltransferase family 4 protein [Bacteroidota bacterium]|nr:glycosyltransferase family 4 protein [Bacteroidota bacterium]